MRRSNQPGRPLGDLLQARFCGLGLRWQRVAAFCAGLLVALGQAPFNFWPLALIGLAASMGLLLQAQKIRHAAWIGWACGLGYFGLALNWIVEPFLVDVARYGWMAPFALLFLAAGLALFWGGAAALSFRFGNNALTWIAALAGAELLRAYIFTGFPWALIGQIWSPYGLAQWAAYFGVHGLNLLTLSASAGLWFAVTQRSYLGIATLVTVAGLAFAGAQIRAQPLPIAEGAPILRLVQPNAPQHLKWDPDYVALFFQRQITATQQVPRPDLIVWPETAVPFFLESDHPALETIAQAAAGVPIIFGIQRFEGRQLFNSAAVMGPQGQITQVYDKYHLVPFGEYMPFGDLMAQFGIHGMAAKDGAGFSAGPGLEVFDLGALGKALVLICYEAVFPTEINDASERPTFLLQLTNDAWFGAATGPYQHLEQARLRAIEQGLPMIRVANTGVSAVIDARGQTVKSLGLGVSGWIDAPLPPAGPATLYSRFGDQIPGLAILLLILAVIAVDAVRRHRIAD